MAAGDPLPTLPDWNAPIGKNQSYSDPNYSARWATEGGGTSTALAYEGNLKPSGVLTEAYRELVLGGQPSFLAS